MFITLQCIQTHFQPKQTLSIFYHTVPYQNITVINGLVPENQRTVAESHAQSYYIQADPILPYPALPNDFFTFQTYHHSPTITVFSEHILTGINSITLGTFIDKQRAKWKDSTD